MSLLLLNFEERFIMKANESAWNGFSLAISLYRFFVLSGMNYGSCHCHSNHIPRPFSHLQSWLTETCRKRDHIPRPYSHLQTDWRKIVDIRDYNRFKFFWCIGIRLPHVSAIYAYLCCTKRQGVPSVRTWSLLSLLPNIRSSISKYTSKIPKIKARQLNDKVR